MSRAREKAAEEAREEDVRQYAAVQSDIDEQFPNRPRNRAKTLPFSELYLNLFNPLSENKRGGAAARSGRGGGRASSKLSPQEQRRKVIEKFIEKWRRDVGDDFYPALRLILPDKDRDRGMYGLKESFIGKLLVKVMMIDRNSEDGYNLLHWRLPGQTIASRMAGDFAGRCREILVKREMRSEPGSLTVADVNELLDKLAAASGEAENLAVFRTFYDNTNSDEMMWLIRIILRQLRVGATEKTFLDIWHPNAEALFGVSSSLRRVCWELHDPDTRLDDEEVSIALMQCFQPQLAQFQMPATFQKVVQHLGPVNGDDEFWIEEKLDGERMQMHMTQDPDVGGGMRFGWWSRKGKDYTYLYGSGYRDAGSAVTRFLDGCFEPRVKNIILDGEMVTWDPKTRKLVTFGTLKTAAIAEKSNQNPDGDEPRPVFLVFDILYLNGSQLTQFTLRDRRRALETTVRGVESRLEVHLYTAARSPDDIEPQLRDVVQRASEGLVLKNPRSPYSLGTRNDDWIKVKPEYMAEFGENLDLVVVGGYYGSGRRGGTLSSFLCGLRASQNHVTAGASPEKCWSFCKVGGGFKAEDYAEIRRLTDGKWSDWDPKRPPTAYLELAGGDRQFERPDVWIRPGDSVVIEIKASSVGASLQFALGKTLRFPRFRRLRTDKRWDEGLDIDAFDQLARRAKEEADQKVMQIENRKRTTKRVKRERVIVGTDPSAEARFFSGAAAAATAAKVFGGMEFCVLTETGKPYRKSKPQLEALIKGHGGAVVQRAVPMSDMVIVAEKKVVKAASLIKAGDVDLVRPKWVMDCLSQNGGAGFVLPYEAEHLFHATNATRRLAGQNTDKFGDSYARDVTLDELREIIDRMPEPESPGRPFDRAAFLADLAERGRELPHTNGLLFHRCVVHFVDVDGCEADGKAGDGAEQRGKQSLRPGGGSGEKARTRLAKLRNYVRFGGASIEQSLGHGVTHVVMVGSSVREVAERAGQVLGDVADMLEVGTGRGVPRVVLGSWVETCWKEATIVDEDDFAAV